MMIKTINSNEGTVFFYKDEVRLLY